MSFEQWKTQVIRQAKRNNVSWLVPNSDTLFSLWQQKLTPEQVVQLHCTKEAQRKRHGLGIEDRETTEPS